MLALLSLYHTHPHTHIHKRTPKSMQHGFLCATCICNGSQQSLLAGTSVWHITVTVNATEAAPPPSDPTRVACTVHSLSSFFLAGPRSDGAVERGKLTLVFRIFSTTFRTLSLFAGCGCLAFCGHEVHVFTYARVHLSTVS